MKSLDAQFKHTPKKVVFCKNCVVSNQRPFTTFNEKGICSACQWSYEKNNCVDWSLREKELHDLLDKHRKNNGNFDCVVPGSGGKDSAYVAHQLKYKYGMNPLCVTWAPFDWTDVGWQNLKAFAQSGFTNQIAQPNGRIHRKLSKLAFELLGDAFVPFIYGQKAYAYKIAQQFDIQLIFYGENGGVEYGGDPKYKHVPKEEPSEWEKYYFKGAELDKLLQIGVDRGLFTKQEANDQTLDWYRATSPEIIEKKKLEMHWYSYYRSWIPQENYYYTAQYTNYRTNNCGQSEGTYTKYASLDDRSGGFHFYLSYMKFGLGRASRDAMKVIRMNHITREEAVTLVRRFDHEFPSRHFHWFLDYLDIAEDHFWAVMDMYRELSNVWVKEKGVWTMTAVVS